MRKLILSIFTALCFMAGAQAQEVTPPYFTTEEMPDLIKCLPAPPDTLGPEFTRDIMRYMWGKQQRLNPERAAIAERDAVFTYEALFAEFNIPFGLVISKADTPEIWNLLDTSLRTTDQMRVAPKAFYKRKRPYVRFEEHLLTPWEEEELRHEGSYPSGHTVRSWTTALLLAEINPAAADTLFARAYMYGESRIIVGAHWQSDIDASRLAASIGYSRLQTSPSFRRQMARAQAEFRQKTLKVAAE